MVVLAHFAHWYHVFLYVSPVALVAVGLWVAGRRMPDAEGDDDELLDDEDAFLDRPR